MKKEEKEEEAGWGKGRNDMYEDVNHPGVVSEDADKLHEQVNIQYVPVVPKARDEMEVTEGWKKKGTGGERGGGERWREGRRRIKKRRRRKDEERSGGKMKSRMEMKGNDRCRYGKSKRWK